MSQEAVAKFSQQIQEDPKLLADFENVPIEELPARMAVAGREHGHDFSEEDVRGLLERVANDAELSDEALEGVAGGSLGSQFAGMDMSGIMKSMSSSMVANR